MRGYALWAAFTAVLAPIASCQEGPCGGIAVGSHLTLTILDYYSGNPNYDAVQAVPGACDFGLDVVKGDVLDATIVASVDDEGVCKQGVPEYAVSSTSWSWTLNLARTQLQDDNGPGAEVLAGFYQLRTASCQGSAWIGLQPNNGDANLFSPPVQGKRPGAVLERKFSASGPPTTNCPANCAGDFVVKVQRVP